MVKISFDHEKMILRAEPEGALQADDFKRLAAEVDPEMAKNHNLNGLMLVVHSCPSWENFDSLMLHLDFVRHHHKKVKKVAVVTKDMLMKLVAEKMNNMGLVHPEIKVFATEDSAEKWIEE